MNLGRFKEFIGLVDEVTRTINPVGLRITPDLHIVFPHKMRSYPAQVA
jgi:hypothetical protein